MNLAESKDFLVNSSSLKEVRIFWREVFEKINLPQDQKDELVLAIAEAAQNIVKHAYKDVQETTDKMEIKISLKDGKLEIGVFDKGKAVVPENILTSLRLELFTRKSLDSARFITQDLISVQVLPS